MKTRARLALHSHVFQNALAMEYEGRPYPMGKGSRFSLTESPREGDLVALMHYGVSPWSLSWVVACPPEDGTGGHLLESVEDGELCDWTNIQLSVFDRDTVAENPHWRWTDEQFAFEDLWRTTFRESGTRHVFRAFPVRFNESGGCTLRVAWRVVGDHSERSFEDWRNVSPAEMQAFCAEAAAAPLDIPQVLPAA